MYNDAVKLRAYTLFLQGLNFEQISAALKNEFSLAKIKGQTVKGWADRPDPSGLTWEDHRTRTREVMRKNTEAVYQNRYTEIREKTETLREALYNQLLSGSTQIKSYEGAIYAFKTITEFGLSLEEMETERMHPVLIVQAMLEVFGEIPAVRKVIKDNWKKIALGIKERLGGAGGIEIEESGK